jgi:hypothetical protein
MEGGMMSKRAILTLIFLLAFSGGPAMATEEPAFELGLKQGAFEVRDYPALVVAEVTVGGDREQASNAGFRLLAGYIFGGNTRRQSIPMTAPVVQGRPAGEQIPMTAPVTQSAAGDAWVVQFVMPAGSVESEMPTPNDARVKLKTLPATRYAVVRFSGVAGEKDVAEKSKQLDAFITKHQMQANGPPLLARYDPPWTPWFMRRTEINRRLGTWCRSCGPLVMRASRS